jgi:hypothetical protein
MALFDAGDEVCEAGAATVEFLLASSNVRVSPPLFMVRLQPSARARQLLLRLMVAGTHPKSLPRVLLPWALDETDPGVRRPVIEALLRVSPFPEHHFRALVRRSREDVRAQCAEAIWSVLDPEAAALRLTGMLKDSSPTVRAWAKAAIDYRDRPSPPPCDSCRTGGATEPEEP